MNSGISGPREVGGSAGTSRERASKLFSTGHHHRRGTSPKFQPFNFRWYDNSRRYFTRVWNLAQRGFYCGRPAQPGTEGEGAGRKFPRNYGKGSARRDGIRSC